MPSVPGGPAIPSSDSALGSGRAEGAKNLRQRSSSQTLLTLATLNTRTLRDDNRLVQLMKEFKYIKWDAVG